MFYLQSRVFALEPRSTVSPEKLQSHTNTRNRCRRLFDSITHLFDSLEASLGHVVTNEPSKKANIRSGVGTLLLEIRVPLPVGSESP